MLWSLLVMFVDDVVVMFDGDNGDTDVVVVVVVIVVFVDVDAFWWSRVMLLFS